MGAGNEGQTLGGGSRRCFSRSNPIRISRLGKAEALECLDMDLSWELALIPFVTAGAGAYFGSYLKTKGENLATHEDIQKVVDEVRAVTTVTKEIEAKISNDVWDRQKRWELKREILFEATKRLADLEDSLLGLHAMTEVEAKEPKGDDVTWTALKNERLQRWRSATTSFDETRQFVEIVCAKETAKVIDKVGTLANVIGGKIISEQSIVTYKTTQLEREKLYLAARTAIRKELGIDG